MLSLINKLIEKFMKKPDPSIRTILYFDGLIYVTKNDTNTYHINYEDIRIVKS